MRRDGADRDFRDSSLVHPPMQFIAPRDGPSRSDHCDRRIGCVFSIDRDETCHRSPALASRSRSKLGARDWNWERAEGKHGAPDRPPKSTIAPPLRSHLLSLFLSLYLSLSLYLYPSISLPPFPSLPANGPLFSSLRIPPALPALFFPYPSPNRSICLSSPPVSLYRTPTSASFALGAAPRSCRWTSLCASMKVDNEEVERMRRSSCTLLVPVHTTPLIPHWIAAGHGRCV